MADSDSLRTLGYTKTTAYKFIVLEYHDCILETWELQIWVPMPWDQPV